MLMDHPVRGRFNAGLLALLDGTMHRHYGPLKTRLLRDAPPVVVELGPGTGANLRYLPPGTRLIAIEPNRHMHPLLQRQAAARGIQLDLRGLAGEALDLPDASVDLVFSSLVLCSVARPAQVIAEVQRVLRPGGRFRCIEHVAAPAGSGLATLQQRLRRPWQWLFEGCDLCRDTGAALQTAGFGSVRVEPLRLDTVFVPIRHQIVAECVK